MDERAQHYTYITKWEDDEGYYVVLCLEWPGLSVDGTTPEIALDRMLRLVSSCLEDCAEDEESPPEPATLKDVIGLTWDLLEEP